MRRDVVSMLAIAMSMLLSVAGGVGKTNASPRLSPLRDLSLDTLAQPSALAPSPPRSSPHAGAVGTAHI